MKSIRTILAATDFSPAAQLATLRAVELARAFGADLTLAHVMSPLKLRLPQEFLPAGFDPEMRLHEEAHAALEAAASSLAAIGVNIRVDFRHGIVLDELLAASVDADIVVLGAYGTAPIRDALLGTTAERLLRKCDKPVLVVKRAPMGGYHSAIVPVDFSPRSASALASARKIAPAAEISVLHVFDAPLEHVLKAAKAEDREISTYRLHTRDEARRELQGFLDACEVAGQVFAIVEHGYPPKIIHEKELELRADLIVIGKSGKGPIEALLLGGVTRHILADCACDVLVVPE
ncbi:MAG: universal stress protein [Betaproteobacteria bacterium]